MSDKYVIFVYMKSQRINRFLLIVAIQRYYMREANRGVTAKRIWHNVAKVYPLSRSTFYVYLDTPAGVFLRKQCIDIKKYNARIEKFITFIDEMNAIHEMNEIHH